MPTPLPKSCDMTRRKEIALAEYAADGGMTWGTEIPSVRRGYYALADRIIARLDEEREADARVLDAFADTLRTALAVETNVGRIEALRRELNRCETYASAIRARGEK